MFAEYLQAVQAAQARNTDKSQRSEIHRAFKALVGSSPTLGIDTLVMAW